MEGLAEGFEEEARAMWFHKAQSSSSTSTRKGKEGEVHAPGPAPALHCTALLYNTGAVGSYGKRHKPILPRYLPTYLRSSNVPQVR